MKHFALLMAVVIAFNNISTSQALQPELSAKSARIKAEVQKRGTSEKSQVRVDLRNRTRVKGYISKIEDTTFEVTAKNTGQATTISYVDVEKIQGAGMSTGAKIGIVAGVAVAVTVVAFVIAFKSHGY